MQLLKFSILGYTLLSIVFDLATASPIISKDVQQPDKLSSSTPYTLYKRTIPQHPNHASILRRASTSLLGPLHAEDVGDGWFATYDPLEALVPRQKAAAGLIEFYEALQTSFTELLNENHPSDWLVEAGEGGIGLRMWTENGDLIPWPVALRFCEWIVSSMLSFVFFLWAWGGC